MREDKAETLERIVDELKRVANVAAVVLGGSHCTGTAHENSDLDIGIYYHADAPFDVGQIRRIAAEFHTDGAPAVTDFYQWGAWANGGAWLDTAAGEVDLIYRSIEQVESTIEKAHDGIWENDFEQQPPYGFSSIIYLAETHYCRPLYDPSGIISELKKEVETYPPKLKAAIVQQSLWAAQFALWQADKFAAKSDIYNAAGCFTRTLKNIVEALFAINETYSIGDKSALQKIAAMPKRPADFAQKIEAVLTITPDDLPANARRLRNLFEQTAALAAGMYQPYFEL